MVGTFFVPQSKKLASYLNTRMAKASNYFPTLQFYFWRFAYKNTDLQPKTRKMSNSIPA